MSDINISNGTCYTAAGERLDDSFIPCGNTAYGYQTCCGAGDNCLADLACFGIHGSGYGSFLTYYAGCTDPDYNDASCPQKVVDQPWVALTLCDDGNAWAICSQPGNPSTLQPGATCSCTSSASATVAFQDARTLANYASLPTAAGETISFFAGHTPTGSPTADATGAGAAATGGGGGSGGGGGGAASATQRASDSGTSATRASATSVASSTTNSAGSTVPVTSGASSSTASSSSDAGSSSSSNGQSGSTDSGSSSSLGTGAIVGIVIGAIAALLIAAAIAFLLFRRKRRRSHIAAEKKLRDSGMSTTPMKPGGPSEYVRPSTPPVPEVDSVPVSEIAGTPAKPWAMRNELDGKEIPSGRNSAAVSTNGTEVGSARYELP